jgi:predicted metal-dependent hydrolase
MAEIPTYKAPKVMPYDPSLEVSSSGPTTSQPDIFGPISQLTSTITNEVIKYQNQKTNNTARIIINNQKQAGEYEIKNMFEQYKDKYEVGSYSGIDTQTGQIRNPGQGINDFRKAAEKKLKDLKKNMNPQAWAESEQLLKFRIGESVNLLQDEVNKDVKKTALSTYKNNKTTFNRELKNSDNIEYIKQLQLMRLKDLQDIRYILSADDYSKEVQEIKNNVYLQSFKLQSGSNNPNDQLEFVLNEKLVDDFSYNDEYFDKVNIILDKYNGNISEISDEDNKKLAELQDRYENGEFKTRSISMDSEFRIYAIKTIKDQIKIYNEATESQQKGQKRDGYASIKNILEPLRGELDLDKIDEAILEAYEIANQSFGETREALRTYINSYFNKGPSNQKMTKYFNDIAEIGGLTNEFRDELDNAVTLGVIKADVANRIIGLHNLNVKKYEDLDEQALKYGLRYLIQKMDPNKVKNYDAIAQNSQSLDDILSQLSSLNITEKTLRALKLYQDTLLEGEAKGLSINQIIYDKKFKNDDGISINALDYVVNLVKEEMIMPTFDAETFPVDKYDLNDDGTVTYDEVDMVEGTGTFARSNIVDVLATTDQTQIAKRRIIGERKIGDGSVVPIYESIESRNTRIALQKNLRRAMQTNKFTPKQLMDIAEIFGFTLDDIKKEVNAINTIKPITSSPNTTVIQPKPSKNKNKKLRFNPVTQEFE